MTHFIALSSLLMMVVCYFLLQQPFRAVYIKILKTYFFAFAASALIVSGISMYQSKDKWFPSVSAWINDQTPNTHALALGTGKESAKTYLPLLQGLRLKEQIKLDVDVISQYPELPRGCEVTSLAMLLNYNHFPADKMELAEQITKDPTPFQRTEKGTFFGNPHDGFVGNMYSLDQPGYGVYHEPVAALAREYAGDTVLNLSGGYFYDVLEQISEGNPVWVIINTTYDELPENQFTTWQTPSGEITITKKEHSVVLTGYDAEYVYFNDPLEKKKRKAPMDQFKKAWVQMGKQAITIETERP